MGGANSGKASTGMWGTSAMPNRTSTTARNTTRWRNWRLVPTNQRMDHPPAAVAPYTLRLLFDQPAEFGSQQLVHPDDHHPRAWLWPLGQDRVVIVDTVNGDALPDEDQRLGVGVHPGRTVHIVVHRGARDGRQLGRAEVRTPLRWPPRMPSAVGKEKHSGAPSPAGRGR